jgi:8-oxo-dGTP diphosphatase
MLVFQRIARVSEGNAAAVLPGQEHLRLLMIRRRNHPNIGMWALPGGFVELRENLEDAAKRELMEETGVENAPMIQLKTYGDYDRDPRWRVITTA